MKLDGKRIWLYSINTQATFGANLVFLDLATGYLGSVHDRMITAYKFSVNLSQPEKSSINPKKCSKKEF